MKNRYDTFSREQLIDKILKLEKDRYGLVWEDKEEDVAKRCDSELPLLKEDCAKEIVCNPSLPYNIIIEGDNYHSLYALSFTHKKSVDVIYIDPPYNTGKKKEWKYNDNWEVPASVDIFSNCEEIRPSAKSILKQEDAGCFIAKKDKNGKSELSTPEKSFITQLENSDDYLQWWYKNGKSECKYFCIAYQKEDGYYYGFFPDFILKTKKETIIVEIKDDKDFKAENYYKLTAGKKYLEQVNSEEKVRFYILSPNCYYEFFNKLNDMDLDNFESLYEHNLMKFIQSQQLQIKDKIKNDEKLTKVEEEYQELFSEYEKSISELGDEKLQRELLELEEAKTIIEQYKTNIDVLSKISKPQTQTTEKIVINTPFNICVLGEVSDQSQIRYELNSYFSKIGVSTTDWDVDFFNNTKLENANIYKSLQKGQTKYDIIIIGQIYHHFGKGNQKANILSELNSDKYVPHIVCSSPKDLLTPNRLIEKLDEYLRNNYVK